LHGEFSGWHNDKCLRRGRRFVIRMNRVIRTDQLFKQRKGKTQGLSGAGLCLADDVVPVEGDRERQLLNRKSVRDA